VNESVHKMQKLVKAGEVFRLQDIQPVEVGIVDRAANKKKWILIKRDEQEGSMAAERTEVVDQGDGQMAVADQADGAADETVVKFELSLPAAVKSELGEKLQGAVERLLEVANSVRTAKEADDGKPSAELVGELRGVQTTLAEVDKVLHPDEDGAQEGAEGAKGSAAAARAAGVGKGEDGQQEPADGLDGTSEETLRKAAETHASILTEKIEAIEKLAGEIADATGMTIEDLDAKLCSMSDLQWQLDDAATVVNVNKILKSDVTESKEEAGSDSEVTTDFDATVIKVAQLHAQLLKERIEVIKKIAKDVADNAKTMELKDLKMKIRKLRSMGWGLHDVAEIVNLGKRDESASDQADDELPPVAGLTEDEIAAIAKGDMEAIQKIGRKMSAARLKEFKKGIETVEQVMKIMAAIWDDLQPAEKKGVAKRALADMGITMDAPYQKTNAGAGVQLDPEAVGTMAENAGADGAVQQELAQLQKKVQKQEADLTKKREELQASQALLKRMESTVEAPTSATPEAPVQVRKGDGDREAEVDWGLDMNDPHYLRRIGQGQG